MTKNFKNDYEMVTVEHPLREMWRVYRKNKAALLGLFLFLFVLALTVVAPYFYQVDPYALAGAPITPPGKAGFFLGTDYIGRDVLAEIIYGGKATLTIGAVAALAITILGTIFGATPAIMAEE